MARELDYESSRVESSAWSTVVNSIVLFIRVFLLIVFLRNGIFRLL